MIWDSVVIATIVISAVIAFFRGFVRETLTIIGVVGGVAGAYYGGGYASPVFRDLLGVTDKDGEGKEEETAKLFDIISYELVADAHAYSLIFIVCVIFFSVISHYLGKATQNSALGIVDRTLGVLFGVLRGIILLGLLFMPVHIYVDAEQKKEWFEGSRSILYVEATADILTEFFPEFEQDPEKIFKTEDIEKAIKSREIIRELEENYGSSENGKAKENAGTKNSDDKPESSGQGYEEDLRNKMKNLLREVPDPSEESGKDSP